MRKSLYPRLALQNIILNRRFFIPYLLTITGTSGAFYIMFALYSDPGARELRGYIYVESMMLIGMLVGYLFSAVILLYTNSFLMKQRKRELGLYNVLGMGKGNIALVLICELLFVGAAGILSGLFLGVIFHKLATLLLFRMLRFYVPFGWRISGTAMVVTVVLFSIVLAVTLAQNLLRIQLSDPVQLLRGGHEGEKEPRTRWLLAILGAGTLGTGYFLALAAKDAISALVTYFLAVILVIIGTLCLFTAGSIFILKLLRANKRFYYQTSHFIGISGMLYRMKRNAVGLANICILSTMVMVMLSGTLSLYLGTGEIVDMQYPADINFHVNYYPETEDERGRFDGTVMMQSLTSFFREQGETIEAASAFSYMSIYVDLQADSLTSNSLRPAKERLDRHLFLFTAADFAAASGTEPVKVGPGQVLLCGGERDFGPMFSASEVTFNGPRGSRTLTVTGGVWVNSLPVSSNTAGDDLAIGMIVADMDEVVALRQVLFSQDFSSSMIWEGRFDLACDAARLEEVESAFWDATENGRFQQEDTGDWRSLSLTLRSDAELDIYAMSGGFLFLGILLGLIFLMATVLIIYYKQISEGYEDRSRFDIMRKVGLSRKQVRASIRSQVLVVFFLPIAVAAVHIAFDFNMVVQLLGLFNLRDIPLTAVCTLGTVLVFFLVYGAVYLITARTYYKIVSDGGR